MAATVGIEGLADFRRALGKMDRSLQTGLRSKLLEAAEVAAEEARRLAPRGTRAIPSGRRPAKRMAETIAPFARGAVAGIRVGALAPGGFAYPKRIEYERGRGTPFLNPAIEAKRGEVERKMATLLDDLADTWETRA